MYVTTINKFIPSVGKISILIILQYKARLFPVQIYICTLPKTVRGNVCYDTQISTGRDLINVLQKYDEPFVLRHKGIVVEHSQIQATQIKVRHRQVCWWRLLIHLYNAQATIHYAINCIKTFIKATKIYFPNAEIINERSYTKVLDINDK